MNPKLALFFFLGLAIVLPAAGLAQTSEPIPIITWKARSYAPAEFSGKPLPISNTPILASLEVFANGKKANISGYRIYWYLNNRLVDRGVGLQSVSIRAPQLLNGGIASLRAKIDDYPGFSVSKNVDIPVVTPSAVIKRSVSGNTFFSKKLEFEVVPYFFNVNDIPSLSFSWKVNNEVVSAAENPQNLVVNINDDAASGSALNVEALVSNPAEFFESAKAKMSLTFSK